MTNSALRLLIVDDEPMLRSVIQEFLDMLGYEDFSIAGDGREALEILRSKPIDCVISDIRMPEMELDELLVIVRREFPHLSVIATSGFSDFSSASNILRKGADDFLGKPLNLDLLELALSWIEKRRRLMAVAHRYFGPQDLPTDRADLLARVEAVTAELRHEQVFAQSLQHAARVTELVTLFDKPEWPIEDFAILSAAAALHELGLNCQVFQLCQLPRRLEEAEYHLILHTVETQARISAAMVGQTDLEPIIARHLEWTSAPPLGMLAPLAQRGAVWLGIANSIDGFLHDRPDRPGTSLPVLLSWLKSRQQQRPMPLLDCWLAHWGEIEAYFQRQG